MLALFALVALGGAAPPPSDLPSVVVFPLTATASLDRETNARIVMLLGEQIAEGGQVRVLPADPEVTRPDYLSSARKAGAQFYVTGFLTPLGSGASIVEQLVSTQSGVIIFSNSGQLQTYRDASGQGDILRAAIVHSSATHGYTSFAPDQQPKGAASAAPGHGTSTTAPEANVGGLFRHRKAPAAAPSPSPAPRAPASP